MSMRFCEKKRIIFAIRQGWQKRYGFRLEVVVEFFSCKKQGSGKQGKFQPFLKSVSYLNKLNIVRNVY
jgi:hypothetical protein